jgi:hypothetical protein
MYFSWKIENDGPAEGRSLIVPHFFTFDFSLALPVILARSRESIQAKTKRVTIRVLRVLPGDRRMQSH